LPRGSLAPFDAVLVVVLVLPAGLVVVVGLVPIVGGLEALRAARGILDRAALRLLVGRAGFGIA
jgi:hypothetical protein